MSENKSRSEIRPVARALVGSPSVMTIWRILWRAIVIAASNAVAFPGRVIGGQEAISAIGLAKSTCGRITRAIKSRSVKIPTGSSLSSISTMEPILRSCILSSASRTGVVGEQVTGLRRVSVLRSELMLCACAAWAAASSRVWRRESCSKCAIRRLQKSRNTALSSYSA